MKAMGHIDGQWLKRIAICIGLFWVGFCSFYLYRIIKLATASAYENPIVQADYISGKAYMRGMEIETVSISNIIFYFMNEPGYDCFPCIQRNINNGGIGYEYIEMNTDDLADGFKVDD